MEWSADLTILTALGATCAVYLRGVMQVWRRAGVGHGIAAWRSVAFAGAILSVGIALLPPLDSLSSVLFSAHMAQHLILTIVVAPLLVLSDFQVALVWALPRRWAISVARRVYRSKLFSLGSKTLALPAFAWLSSTIIFWGWHAPLLFEAALQDERIHALEHVSFLLSSILFWWVLVKPSSPKHIHYVMAVAYLFATSLQSTVLGALMTFGSAPWYPYYATLVTRWGMTPLQDQQLAGLLMWMPGGFLYSLLTIAYFAAWLGVLQRRSGPVGQRAHVRTRQ